MCDHRMRGHSYRLFQSQVCIFRHRCALVFLFRESQNLRTILVESTYGHSRLNPEIICPCARAALLWMPGSRRRVHLPSLCRLVRHWRSFSFQGILLPNGQVSCTSDTYLTFEYSFLYLRLCLAFAGICGEGASLRILCSAVSHLFDGEHGCEIRKSPLSLR